MNTEVPAGTRAVEAAPPPPSGNEFSSLVRFGMPHAFVIVAFVVTAAVLAKLGMDVQDALLLVGGAGAMGAAIVLLVAAGGRSGSRVGRALRAYLGSAN